MSQKKILSTILMILIIIVCLLIIVANTKAVVDNKKTVFLTGVIDKWYEIDENTFTIYTVLYGGLSDNKLTFILKNSDGTGNNLEFNYTERMTIDFPLKTMKYIIATQSSITYEEQIKPDTETLTHTSPGIPGFELPIFFGALVVCGIIIRIKKFNVRKK